MTCKIKKTLLYLVLLLLTLTLFTILDVRDVFADNLNDNINEQLQKLDINKLEEFFNSLSVGEYTDFSTFINGLLNGTYNLDFASIFGYVANIFLNDLYEMMPTFLSIVAISIFCVILQNVRGTYLSEGVCEVVFFACICAVITLVLGQVLSMWHDVKNIIENIAKLTEIMSPIIITLMLAVGGNVSAAVYKPAVAFLSSGITNVLLYLVMPLIALMTVFNVANNFSSSVKLNKFSDFAASSIKWIIGLLVTVFTMFLSVQGITSASFDGVSIKAAKYAISNSIPLVGGFLKDGFDLVVAGSVLIKHTIGIAGIVALFFLLLSPILYMLTFSLLLKLVSAIIEPISDGRIANFCVGLSKTVSYLIATLLTAGLMLFITVLLMIFSANAFI